ncbi:MAG TPA: o-succinylbenzoate synthase [Rhodothermales bacterium]|nr:o-succinylbenzoate synthase [Rhodothermales bacterium]
MHIESVRVYRYVLPFREPVLLKGWPHAERRGLLIELGADSGQTGWGEVAPLPGFSKEMLADAERQLLNLGPGLIGIDPERIDRGPYGILRFGGNGLASSVRFGIESALWDLVLDASPSENASDVAVNALLVGDREEVVVSAKACVAMGFRTVKLKVGRNTVQEDLETMGALVSALGPGIRVRLDANRAWTFGEALAFIADASDLGYEYLEEPLADAADLRALVDRTGARIALDESLCDVSADRLHEHDYATAIVLKPTLIGGLSTTARHVAAARGLGMVPVLSAAFESGVGIGSMARLAEHLSMQGTAMGFDTYSRLAEDVLDPGLDMNGGILTADSFARSHHAVRRDMLEEVKSFTSSHQ